MINQNNMIDSGGVRLDFIFRQPDGYYWIMKEEGFRMATDEEVKAYWKNLTPNRQDKEREEYVDA